MNNPPKVYTGKKATCKFPVAVELDFQDTGGTPKRLEINAVFELKVSELLPKVDEEAIKYALKLNQPAEIKRTPQDICAQLAERIRGVFTPTLLNTVVPNGFFEDQEIYLSDGTDKIFTRYSWHWRKYEKDEGNPLPKARFEQEAISAWRHDDKIGTVGIMLEPNDSNTTVAWERRCSKPWKRYIVELDFKKTVTLLFNQEPALLEKIFKGKIVDQSPNTRVPKRKKSTHKRQ